MKNLLISLIVLVVFNCNQSDTKAIKMKNENQPNFLNLYTNLMVDDVGQSIEFYEKIGFKVSQKLPDSSPVWALVEKDNVKLMFQSTKSLQEEFSQLRNKKVGGTITLWIQVKNIESYYQLLKGKVEVIKPIGITSYNKATEFVIMDINGYLLHFSDLALEG